MDLASITASKILTEFKPLIYKTIQRLNIHPNHMNYDDYVQELQIKLIDIHQSFEGDPLTNDVDRYKFTAYAGQGLYWHLIDLFKNQKFDSLQPTEEEQLEWLNQQQGTSPTFEENSIYINDFIQKAKERLTEEEFLLFRYLAEGDYTITEIADILGVSRAAIYKRRDKIQKKLKTIKDCLLN